MDGADRRPNRADIEERWTAIIDGRQTREEVHKWAEQLMLGDVIDDLMVSSALEYLHGFDLIRDGPYLRHGAPGDYVKSIEEVANELVRWRGKCEEYDLDPEGWVRQARARARWLSRRKPRRS